MIDNGLSYHLWYLLILYEKLEYVKK